MPKSDDISVKKAKLEAINLWNKLVTKVKGE